MQRITKHPLLWPAIAFSAGIAFASGAETEWRIGFATAAVGFLAALRWRWILVPAWFFLGAALLSFRFEARDPIDLRNQFGGEPQLVIVRGVLDGDPERRVLAQDQRTRYRTTARMEVKEIEWRGAWRPAKGEVAVSTTGFLEDTFVAGAAVEVAGVLEKPGGPVAPGMFDFERYLKWQRIFFVLRAEGTNDWRLARRAEGWSGAALYRKFNAWAMRTLQRGIPADENTRLLWAMTLGWRPGLTNEISEPFMRTGTLHIFAISGLHIALIAMILVKVFQRLRLSRVWAGALAIPLIWFYTGATGWQASAIRSTIMSSVIILGWILRRPNNLLNSLAASAILILLWQPEQLFQAGYQLSFLLLATFAVWPGISTKAPWPDPTVYLGQKLLDEFESVPKGSWWCRVLARFYEWATGRDPFLPDEMRPKWRRRLDHPIEFLLGGINISLASLIGSLPVIALYFNLISYSSLVANLVIVPISGITLGAALASWGLAWLPGLSIAANWVSWGTMWFMVWFCRMLESFSWSYQYVTSPSVLTIVAYYVALLALVNGWLRNKRVLIAVAALVFVAAGVSLRNEQIATRLTLLPGSGTIFVDRPRWREDLLVNVGRDREVATMLKPFLHSCGVDALDEVVLTHGAIAHVGGYSRLVEEFRVKETVTTAARSRSKTYREIIRALEEKPRAWRKVAAGDEVRGWTVLHPEPGQDFPRADDEAIVLARTIEGHRILLLSELGAAGQDRLLQSATDLNSEILFCAISADGHPPRPELLQRIDPRIIIVSGNAAKSSKAVQEMRRVRREVYSTREEGAVSLEIHAGKVEIRGMRP